MTERADHLDEVLRGAVDAGELTGVAAAAWTADGGVYLGAFGDATPGTAMATDTVVWIASMTKAVTATAAMQLVERGQLTLDEPLGDLVAYLGRIAVLDGFEDDGSPRLRDPARPVTLRHLLTHTAGFGYDFADAALSRFVGTQPTAGPGTIDSFELPLLFDPGDRWCYGVNIDWVGQVLEAVTGERLDTVLAASVLEPLGMVDTGFARTPAQRVRSADVHLRTDDGLTAIPFELPEDPEFLMGGGGLYSTVEDYLRFTRMLLGRGTLDGARVLAPETVDLMARNHLGALPATGWQSVNPIMTNDVDLTEDGPQGWGLSFLINAEPSPEGRSAGSLSWAGLANTYYWVDHQHATTGVFATQVLPFYDPAARRAFRAFEAAVQQER